MSEIQVLQQKVNELHASFKQINERETIRDEEIKLLNKNMTRLLVLMEGDPAEKDKGFIARLRAVEEFISWFRDKKSYVMGNVMATVVIVSTLGYLVIFVMKVIDFFKK